MQKVGKLFHVCVCLSPKFLIVNKRLHFLSAILFKKQLDHSQCNVTEIDRVSVVDQETCDHLILYDYYNSYFCCKFDLPKGTDPRPCDAVKPDFRCKIRELKNTTVNQQPPYSSTDWIHSPLISVSWNVCYPFPHPRRR